MPAPSGPALTRREALAASLVPLAGCQTPVARSRSRVAQTRPRHEITGRARIGFVGDLQLGRDVSEYHADRPPESVWGSTIDRLRSLDGLIGNLECVLTDRGEAWPDKRWRFRTDPAWALPALEAAGTSAVSLANNHTLDFGAESLLDTIHDLATIDVANAGAGATLERAIEPAIFEVGSVRVAMVGFTDRFSPFAASADRPGTAHLTLSVDSATTRRTVFEALARADAADPDLVVASLHWGANYEPKTDDHERFGRWLIDQGVDVVHGHSAHVVRGVEVYRGRPIVYDAGDFVNDYSPVEGFHNDRSFLVELAVDDGLEELRLTPVEIETSGVALAGEEATAWLHEEVRTRSAPYGTTIEPTDDGDELSIPLGGSEA